MARNILITGAAGYIGGSLVADLQAGKVPSIKTQNIFAAVRSDEQAKAVSALGIHVLQFDLKDEAATIEAVLQNNISIVIQTASAIDPSLSFPLLTALSKQKERSGEDTFFIHTSGLSAFFEKTGWVHGTMRDTGPIFETEKKLADSFPIRKTDVSIIEHAKAVGVTSFIVVPSMIYGQGSGPWNRLSVVLPMLVKASIAQKAVHKFPENIKWSGAHITDLTSLYATLVEKILQKTPIPSDEEGYYFALAHSVKSWTVLDRLAAALYARGLVTEPEARIWSSDEAAAEALGVPQPFVQPLWNSEDDIVAERPRQTGWKPEWDEDRLLQNIDDEINDVLELGQAKSSLISSLFEFAKGG